MTDHLFDMGMRQSIVHASSVELSHRGLNEEMGNRIGRRQVITSASIAVAAAAVHPGETFALQGPTDSAPLHGCAEKRDEIYYDQLGLIVQRNCDGGDTAQREGMYWLGNWMWENDLKLGRYGTPRRIGFTQAMDLLEDENKTGAFRRHPTQKDHKLTEKTSRDQLIPLIAAMGVYRDFDRLDRLRNRIRKNSYRVNKDLMLFFEEYMKRALDRDLQVGGETDKVILDKAVDFLFDHARGKMDNVGDDLNLVVQLTLAAVRRGEKVKAIRARYATQRPKNYGVYLTSTGLSFQMTSTPTET